jgi:hypothetical protein
MRVRLTAAMEKIQAAIVEKKPAPFVFFACVQDIVAAGAIFTDTDVATAESESRRAHTLGDQEGALAAPGSPTRETDDTKLMVRTSEEAAEFVDWHMQSLGFDDVYSNSPWQSGGFVVVSDRTLAHVAIESRTIDAPIVQRARDTASNRELVLVYAPKDYTASAEEFADRAGVALYAYDAEGKISPTNAVARNLTGSSSPQVSFSEQQRAKGRMQEVFDAASNRVFAVFNRAMGDMRPGDPRQQVALQELEEVSKLLDTVHQKTMSMQDMLLVVDKLDAIGRRAGAI